MENLEKRPLLKETFEVCERFPISNPVCQTGRLEGYKLRWRRISKRSIPVATETFRDWIFPVIGIFTRKSHLLAVSFLIPFSSLPTINAIGIL